MPPFPNMTFDLDLWPTDLKINRDHLLIKDYLPTKFEASGAKCSWVISCTRLRATDIPTDRPTYRPTCAMQYAPPFSKGGINIYPGTMVAESAVANSFKIGLLVFEILHNQYFRMPLSSLKPDIRKRVLAVRLHLNSQLINNHAI